IQFLSDQTKKYQPMVEEHEKKNGIAFAEMVTQNLDPKIEGLVITNYQKSGPQAQLFYVMRIDRKQIELAESSQTAKNNIRFSFEEKEIYLNKRAMGSVFFSAFSMRIRKILSDIKLSKATVYEETKRLV
ncbi:hypothetical protein ACFL96_20500, partial [Thermoproteota archaeon]